jgi:hypothetical protein
MARKMMLTLRALCLSASGALLLGACASQPRVVVVHEPNPEQPPTHIPLQSEANVEVPGTIKAYPVARYIDPSNPRIMHERHVIYRREEDCAAPRCFVGTGLVQGRILS